MKRIFLVILVLSVLISMPAQKSGKWPTIKGPYFGQKLPGMKVVPFAKGIVEDSINTVFSPAGTEFYFVPEGGIRVTINKNGTWQEPRKAEFDSTGGGFDLAMSYDGNRVVFRDRGTLPDQDNKEKKSYIWQAVRNNGVWSKPEPVSYEGKYLTGGYPWLAENNNLYLPMRDPGRGKFSDVYMLKYQDGKYQSPVCLNNDPDNLYLEGDLCVAADESFVITSCWDRPDMTGGKSDLYITFKKQGGSWTRLINMGQEINSNIAENCPTITPDGRFFIFLRYKESKVWHFWVSAKYIKKLRLKQDIR